MTPDAPEFINLATPAQLEAWRNIGLLLDRQGRFWHGGALVEHRRLHLALLRWLARREDGRYIVRLDDTRFAYVEVEDAPLRVVSLRVDGGIAMLLLDDESEEPLAGESLTSPDGEQIYVRVRGGAMWARFLSAAHQALEGHLHAVGDHAELRVGEHVWAIARGGIT